MKNNFKGCLKIILHHEGGYVNHPKDPGGMTNLGVTKRVYEDYIGEEVDEATMRALTPEDVAPLYKKNYWDRTKCDRIAKGLDLCVFDFSVNGGTGRGAKTLQKMIGTVVDGGIGPNTLKKLDEYLEQFGVEEAIKNYQAARQEFYEGLKTFETFGRGWTRRVNETTESALRML